MAYRKTQLRCIDEIAFKERTLIVTTYSVNTGGIKQEVYLQINHSDGQMSNIIVDPQELLDALGDIELKPRET